MRIFFATDLHGSEVCFRKFVAAAAFYKASKLFLGGDLSGKAFAPIWKLPNCRWESYANGQRVVMQSLNEKAAFIRRLADRGYYTYEIERHDYESLSIAEKLVIVEKLICDRLNDWINFATDKLKSTGTEIFVIAGNDDPPAINTVLSGSHLLNVVDGRVAFLDEGVQILGYGYSTPTPWCTYREQSDESIADRLRELIGQLRPDLPAIFHIHVPPFNSGLDSAPALDANLRPIIGSGGTLMVSVGSRAVRDAILRVRPMLGLFGHVHEARSVTRIGPTLCVNPGSTYNQGRLCGLLATIKDGRVHDWQLTEG
jgi:Icc-related predicted phosphoesterase